MTRINLIPPRELHQKHLVAEYRELPRAFPLALAAIKRGMKPDHPRIPRAFTLSTGHVLFFYPRLLFLVNRQISLVEEMLRRGYKPTFDPYQLQEVLVQAPLAWTQDYVPTPEAIALSRARIEERVASW